jgi:hypothetical protein
MDKVGLPFFSFIIADLATSGSKELAVPLESGLMERFG